MTQEDINHWYPLYVKSRSEKKVYTALTEKNYEVYLPLFKTKRRWSDRWKKVQLPMFPGYIFVRTNPKHKTFILSIDNVVGFIIFNREMARIPDEQIDIIRRFTEHPELVRVGTGKLREGQWVKVTSGPFSGMKGRISKVKNMSRLHIGIDVLSRILSVEIDEVDVTVLPELEQ
jgi:transcription termination/antitermination protein NusG